MRHTHDTFQVAFHQSSPLMYKADADPVLESRWVNKVLPKWFSITKEKREPCIKAYTIHTDKVLRQIHWQQDQIAMIYGRRCRGILMGPEQLDMTVHECQPMIFEMQFPMNGEHGIRIMNLPVEVIPWMSGVLLLPKL